MEFTRTAPALFIVFPWCLEQSLARNRRSRSTRVEPTGCAEGEERAEEGAQSSEALREEKGLAHVTGEAVKRPPILPGTLTRSAGPPTHYTVLKRLSHRPAFPKRIPRNTGLKRF